MTGFSPSVRDALRDGTQRSAAVLAPLLYDACVPPHADAPRVLDIGCGEGWFALAFAELGCDVVGVDAPGTEHQLGDRFIPLDLEESALKFTAASVVICLEVAEHLTPQRAPGFIADLCAGPDVVIFSAAIPSQGGVHHVNEQWPAYWAELFAANGLTTDDEFRWTIWNDERIECWYRQNIVIYDRRGLPGKVPLPVVHPRLFESRGWR